MIQDLHQFLRSRRSIRRFQPDRVPADVVHRILETATFAPSAHNTQPWRFAVLTSLVAKSRLAKAMEVEFRRDLERDKLLEAEVAARLERSRRRILEAPVIIVLCMDESGMDLYPDARREQAERTMAVQSTALAGLQLLLAAHAEGLGSVWTCAPLFAPEAVRSTLSLPKEWQPQGMFFIGYPAETPREKPLKPVSQVVHNIS